MKNFAGIEDEYCTFEAASTLLQSIPYDGTSTWGKRIINNMKDAGFHKIQSN
jgi:agmatinase